MTQKVILVVEDHQFVRAMLIQWLGEEFRGCVIIEAANGEDAVRLAAEAQPDIVLMDIGLPGINGFEAAECIHREQPSIAIIMLTLFDSPDFRRLAIEAGARAYVSKTSMQHDLLPAITTCLEQTGSSPAILRSH